MMMPTRGFTGTLYRRPRETLNRRLFERIPQAAEQLPGGGGRAGTGLLGSCLPGQRTDLLQARGLDLRGELGPGGGLVRDQALAPRLEQVLAVDALAVDFAASFEGGTDGLHVHASA